MVIWKKTRKVRNIHFTYHSSINETKLKYDCRGQSLRCHTNKTGRCQEVTPYTSGKKSVQMPYPNVKFHCEEPLPKKKCFDANYKIVCIYSGLCLQK